MVGTGESPQHPIGASDGARHPSGSRPDARPEAQSWVELPASMLAVLARATAHQRLNPRIRRTSTVESVLIELGYGLADRQKVRGAAGKLAKKKFIEKHGFPPIEEVQQVEGVPRALSVATYALDDLALLLGAIYQVLIK
jgi:hypothetical protein